MNQDIQCVAFKGRQRIASGELKEVALKARKAGEAIIFDDATSEIIDIDLSGTPRDLQRRLDAAPPAEPAADPEPRPPGRPKLGVVAREVTLLPRHWDWLSLQPGGPSVALRKLVEGARRVHREDDRLRTAREAAYRFLSAMAGNESGFEEATRGLFTGDPVRFAQHSQSWPPDVREHAARLAQRAFEPIENNP